MAKVGPNIPNPVMPEVIANYAEANGYQDQIWFIDAQNNQTLIPNPETKLAFVERMLLEILIYPTVQKAGSAAEVLARKAKRDTLA